MHTIHPAVTIWNNVLVEKRRYYYEAYMPDSANTISSAAIVKLIQHSETIAGIELKLQIVETIFPEQKFYYDGAYFTIIQDAASNNLWHIWDEDEVYLRSPMYFKIKIKATRLLDFPQLMQQSPANTYFSLLSNKTAAAIIDVFCRFYPQTPFYSWKQLRDFFYLVLDAEEGIESGEPYLLCNFLYKNLKENKYLTSAKLLPQIDEPRWHALSLNSEIKPILYNISCVLSHFCRIEELENIFLHWETHNLQLINEWQKTAYYNDMLQFISCTNPVLLVIKMLKNARSTGLQFYFDYKIFVPLFCEWFHFQMMDVTNCRVFSQEYLREAVYPYAQLFTQVLNHEALEYWMQCTIFYSYGDSDNESRWFIERIWMLSLFMELTGLRLSNDLCEQFVRECIYELDYWFFIDENFDYWFGDDDACKLGVVLDELCHIISQHGTCGARVEKIMLYKKIRDAVLKNEPTATLVAQCQSYGMEERGYFPDLSVNKLKL